MAALHGQDHRPIGSRPLNREPPSSHARRPNDATPTQHSATAGTRRDAQAGASPTLPLPPFHLPGPENIHRGWEASNVSTAKCDMCHRQRCGTIQKCIQCKLSVCKDCALAGRLQNDGRHVLDPHDVNWDKPSVFKGRRARAPRGGRGRGARGAVRPREQGRARGKGPREQLPRPTSSRATLASFSPTASPRTETTSLNVDDDWEQDCGWGGDQDEPPDEAASIYNRPMERVRNAIGRASCPPAEVEDVAEILAGMPGCLPDNANGAFMKRGRGYQQSPLDNTLPPVRPVPGPRQPELLPPLRMLHPALGSESAQLQPSMLHAGFRLPRSTPVAYMGQFPASQDMHRAYQNGAHPSQGHASPDVLQQASHGYSYPPTAVQYCGSSDELASYGVPPASPTARHPVLEPQVDPPPSHNGANPVASPRWHVSRGYGDCTDGYRPLPVHPSQEFEPAAASPGRPRNSPAMPAAQLDERFRPRVEEQGVELKDSACAIQKTEHPDWPLDQCLRLALERCWFSMHAHFSNADRQKIFHELLAATYFAMLDLGLPAKRNAARDWLCERERQLADEGMLPISRMRLSSFLSSLSANKDS